MSQLIRKENIVATIGEYPDPQNNGTMKKRYRTVGELITMVDNNGSHYQFIEMWDMHGSTKLNIYEQTDRNSNQPNQQQQNQYQQEPHQGQYYERR